MAPRAASIGECMLELSPRDGGLFALGYGGDTLNTAVYMARLGVAVDYLTALGDDGFSDKMLAAWRAEGVGTGQVRRLPGRLPGLYLIETDAQGERRFSYWRDRAPARELFALPETPSVVDAIAGYNLVYLSGISLSLYGAEGRQVLMGALDAARAGGAQLAFDSNYRPRNWPDIATARAAMAEILKRTDIALVSFDDERALWNDDAPIAAARRLATLGPAEVVVKDAADPAVVLVAGASPELVVPESAVTPVDTTAAGDSFNAAYLAARLNGVAPIEAARAGHRLAAAVIRHPGAIIPRRAMPATI
ncbi:MAG: sugar kinase [Alphaproteobacteria bacterium]|nr:sugar kinase [Alphaproteobacteria bacterium]